MRARVLMWIWRLCLVQLVCTLSMVMFTEGKALAQDPGPVTKLMIDQAGAKIAALEADKADARLRVLESDMGEQKILLRAVSVAVIGQLVVTWFKKEQPPAVKPAA